MFILRLLLMMAKEAEVARSFQALRWVRRSFFLGSHESQVADLMIEARR